MAIPQSTDVNSLLYGMTPEEVVASRGHFVTVTLSTHDTQSGYLFTIDPVNGTVILKHESEDKAIVLLRHHVKSIQVNTDNRLSQSQLEDLLASDVGAESLKHDSEAMRRRKQQAINLLESVGQKKKNWPLIVARKAKTKTCLLEPRANQILL
ncbi:unnamed protein product [Umbelopsis ramanniana]